MKSTDSIIRDTDFTDIRETLKLRLLEYLERLYTYNTAKMVSRDVRVATGEFIAPSTIANWLSLDNSPSREREVLLDITYEGLTEYLREPFRKAHKTRKERELEAIIAQNTQQLAELRAG